jgi:predicted phosphodiesterase
LKKNPLEEFVGQDKKRQIRLNRVELKVNSKGYAPLLFFGDLHYGSPQCEMQQAQAMLDWALRENVSILLMGDLLEMSLRDSVGHGVYQQKTSPQAQVEGMIEILKPLADVGLIIGMHEGNHSQRVTKATGVDVTKLMARILNVPYCGYAGWHLIKVGKQNYTVYSTHGSSNATLGYTKLNSAIKISYFLNADCIAYGHTHEISTATRIIQQVDLRNKMVIEKKQYIVMTGSYLSWSGGYAEQKGLAISKLGSPKAKFLADSHDIHFSL